MSLTNRWSEHLDDFLLSMKKEAVKPKGNLYIKHDHLLSYKLLAYLLACMPFIQTSKHLWSSQYCLTLCPSYSPLPQLPFLSLAQHTPTSGACYPLQCLPDWQGRIGPSFLCPCNLRYRTRKFTCLSLLTKSSSKKTTSWKKLLCTSNLGIREPQRVLPRLTLLPNAILFLYHSICAFSVDLCGPQISLGLNWSKLKPCLPSRRVNMIKVTLN